MIDHLILASASPARLQLLQRAGVAVSAQVSGVDEAGVTAGSVAELTARLAELKAEAVFAAQPSGVDLALVGCDSLLELDGRACGKPENRAEARASWQGRRGRAGVLHTGHHLIVRRGTEVIREARVASTVVHFADLDDAEIEAYLDTGEPDWVAGAFTIDGYGGAFVERIEGDPHNVVGLSLPLLRDMVRRAGVSWVSLWRAPLE